MLAPSQLYMCTHADLETCCGAGYPTELAPSYCKRQHPLSQAHVLFDDPRLREAMPFMFSFYVWLAMPSVVPHAHALPCNQLQVSLAPQNTQTYALSPATCLFTSSLPSHMHNLNACATINFHTITFHEAGHIFFPLSHVNFFAYIPLAAIAIR